MCRNAAARRRRSEAEERLAVCGRVEADDVSEELREEGDRLREANETLRDRIAEVEGWYRLLQVNHSALQVNHDRTSRRTSELQVEVNRLEAENHELNAWLSRLGEPGHATRQHDEESRMNRFARLIRGIRNHRWTAAAVMAIVTLLARDASVQGVLAGAADTARQAVGRKEDPGRSGFVRYAAMVNSRDQLERARQVYNQGEATLKGDALLEAQDALRAAKARYREARLAFLPELARQCELAKVALPTEATEALASLERDRND